MNEIMVTQEQFLELKNRFDKFEAGYKARTEMVEKGLVKLNRSVKDIEEEYPLLPPEAEDLSNLVKRKGCEILGGKKSEAYADTGLRKRVYQDIYLQIKREYGLINEFGRQLSYKKLKRKYLPGAMAVVEEYEVPVSLGNEIDALNELEE